MSGEEHRTPITETEANILAAETTPERPLSLAFGPGRVSLVWTWADRWAALRLVQIRGLA